MPFRPLRSAGIARSGFALLVGVAALAASARAGAQTIDDSNVDAVGGDDAVAGELVVDLRADARPEDLADIVREAGGDLRWNSEFSEGGERLSLAHVDAARSGAIAAILERLRGDPRVEAVEENEILRASFVPNDPLYGEKQWHLARVGAERAWEYGCGTGVTVAIVDTGVACFDKGPFTRGTDLAGTRCEGGYNFVHDSAEAFDDQGHGTHVAGTVAQTTNNGKGVAGLAYCANLMPVKVLNKNGWGTLADVAEGIRYAADHGARVVNLSLGGPRPASALEKAVKYAIKKGVVIVAAAGNSGKSVGYPAAYPGVIAVSATDSNDRIAWFSSRGTQVGIAAPGVSVTQQTICEGGRNKCELFGTFNGTSMASPHVAGAAALVAGMGVSDADAIRSALEKTANGKDDPKLYGAGVLDAGAAIAKVHWSRTLERAFALIAFFALVAMRIKRKGGWMHITPGAVFGALLGGIGIAAFLPLTGVLPRLGDARIFGEILMRPFGEWDVLLLGGSLHRWLLLASAGPALLGYALFFGVRSIRPALGGFAIGAAALLTQTALMADVAFPLGSLMLRIFAVANVLTLLWLARTALDRRPL
jgi:serine protease